MFCVGCGLDAANSCNLWLCFAVKCYLFLFIACPCACCYLIEGCKVPRSSVLSRYDIDQGVWVEPL